MTETADLTGELVTFVRQLDSHGVEVPADGALTAAEAVSVLRAPTRETTRVALRSSLLTRRADFDQFDRLFPILWRRLTDTDAPPYPSRSGTPADPLAIGSSDRTDPSPATDDREDAEEPPGPAPTATARHVVDRPASPAEETARSRYSPVGDSERVTAESMPFRSGGSIDRPVARFVRSLAALAGRRWEPDPTGGRVDGPRALRRSLETGGTVLSLPRRDRERSQARAVIFVDVSRSVVEAIDRGFLLRFLRTLHSHLRSTRIFFFDTELREVTAAFDTPTLREAVQELDRSEARWGGGTRIGASLSGIQATPDAVDWRTSVLIVSDGLERGDVHQLEDALAWLARRAGTVLWLNPLAVSAEYEPTARGMAAAMPHLDGFYGFTGPDDVTRIAEELRMHGPDRTRTAARTVVATNTEDDQS